MYSISRWIVGMIGNRSSCLQYLKDLLTAIKSFYHPSNTGDFQENLVNFILNLSSCFVERVHLYVMRRSILIELLFFSSLCRERKKSSCVVFHATFITSTYRWRYYQFRPLYQRICHSCLFSIRIMPKKLLKLASIYQYLRPRINRTNDCRKVWSFSTLLFSFSKRVICFFFFSLDSSSQLIMLVNHIDSHQFWCVLLVFFVKLSDRTPTYAQGQTFVLPLITAVLPGIDLNDFKKDSSNIGISQYYIHNDHMCWLFIRPFVHEMI